MTQQKWVPWVPSPISCQQLGSKTQRVPHIFGDFYAGHKWQ